MEFKDFASIINLLNDIEKFEEENIEKFQHHPFMVKGGLIEKKI